ncbi:MAG: sigma-70 family RNA polymerase sigma factor [Polyangiaceae bacterium]
MNPSEGAVELFGVPPEQFEDYVREREKAPGERQGFNLPDLAVACACMHGRLDAITLLQGSYMRALDPHLRKLGLEPAAVEDVKQTLLRQLLVGQDGPPRLAQYDGRGALGAWLRVSAVRLGLKVLRSRKRTDLLGDEDAKLEAVASSADPEASYMKEAFREIFRQSFREALASLEPKERNIVRQSLIDGLSIDELGELYGVHRATAARWLHAAKERIMVETRARFAAKSRASQTECDSMFRMISSHLDLSIRRHLVA